MWPHWCPKLLDLKFGTSVVVLDLNNHICTWWRHLSQLSIIHPRSRNGGFRLKPQIFCCCEDTHVSVSITRLPLLSIMMTARLVLLIALAPWSGTSLNNLIHLQIRVAFKIGGKDDSKSVAAFLDPRQHKEIWVLHHEASSCYCPSIRPHATQSYIGSVFFTGNQMKTAARSNCIDFISLHQKSIYIYIYDVQITQPECQLKSVSSPNDLV